jgi:glycosyltransferase involved in cell wall biosynthesis
MNFVHSGTPATALLAGRTRLRGGNVAATRHAVIIPSYNTGTRLFDTVAAIRRQEWRVWVIIDGSTDGTGEELARIAANDPALHICVLPQNRGKGAAILHGLRLAHTNGFTHAVTVDADGQHSADHIEGLVALSDDYPEAMILGVPVFDASAPAIRITGHVVANFWANLVTLWAGIGDSLFGFRVYPIAPLLRTFEQTRWMRRFDFDSEAAIRLAWQGVPPINVPTPVRYYRREDGGVSHFNYLRDNALLVLMYTRLFAVLLANLRGPLARRFRSFRH